MAEIMVNGESRVLDGLPLHTNALDFLRDLGLTGAKEGCAEGECGACSVLVARPAPDGSDATEWTAINSCLVPAASLDGQEVVTAEGLGEPTDLHPVQREMAVRGGSQCGYCTPGFVCSMAAEFYRAGRAATNGSTPQPHDDYHGDNGFDLHALSGNLCRCTGYRPIRDAAYALGFPDGDDRLASRRTTPAPAAPPTRLYDGEAGFVRPADLAEALALLAEDPDAVVVAGSTDWGVDVNLKGAAPRPSSPSTGCRSYAAGRSTDGEIRIGAALTLSEIERRLDGRLPLLAALFPQFASRLIRNGATLGGNLGTGSPIGDAPPVLLALEAVLVLASPQGNRFVPLADYFTGYRESVRRPDELITEVLVPLPAGAVDGVPQDRQASVRRHLQRGGRPSRSTSVDGTVRRRGSGSAGWPPHRSGRWRRRRRSRAGRGTPTRSTRPRGCWPARGRRSPTSGRVRSSAPRCWGSRCGSCLRTMVSSRDFVPPQPAMSTGVATDEQAVGAARRTRPSARRCPTRAHPNT